MQALRDGHVEVCLCHPGSRLWLQCAALACPSWRDRVPTVLALGRHRWDREYVSRAERMTRGGKPAADATSGALVSRHCFFGAQSWSRVRKPRGCSVPLMPNIDGGGKRNRCVNFARR